VIGGENKPSGQRRRWRPYYASADFCTAALSCLTAFQGFGQARFGAHRWRSPRVCEPVQPPRLFWIGLGDRVTSPEASGGSSGCAVGTTGCNPVERDIPKPESEFDRSTLLPFRIRFVR